MALWRLLKTPNVFTLEASFLGYQKRNSETTFEYTPSDYKSIGQSVCLGLCHFLQASQAQVPRPLKQLPSHEAGSRSQGKPALQHAQLKSQLNLAQQKQHASKGSISSTLDIHEATSSGSKNPDAPVVSADGQPQEIAEQFSGSDSEPSEDELEQELIQRMIPKHCNKKSKRKKKMSE